ncbi:MAG: hypothetical protein L0216_20730 [Planctomycetales bacterium]|nr:hypothetical protein [Planctomycetales bacterium]
MTLRRATLSGLVLAALAALDGPARADRVHLYDGKVIEGKIVGVTDEHLEVSTAAGTVKVPRGDVFRTEYDEDAAAAREAEREKADAKAKAAGESEAPSLAGAPALPTREKPAGGRLVGRDLEGRLRGLRSIRLVPRPAGGFRYESVESRLNEHGRPEFVAAGALHLDADLQAEAFASRLTGTVLGRPTTISLSAAVRGGKLRVVERVGESGAPEVREAAAPEGVELGDSLLARLLHGAALEPLAEAGKLPARPFPELGAMVTGLETVERSGEEKAEDGSRRLAVKIRREFPGSEIPTNAELALLVVAGGRPVALAEIEGRDRIRWKAATAAEAAEAEERLPDAWRTFRPPEPPAAPGAAAPGAGPARQ